MVNARAKGQRAEREALGLLQEWMEPVYRAANLPAPMFARNLEQSRGGGYDILGLEWLALEVKHREALHIPKWWEQTLRQAKDGQLPFLMWKRNGLGWSCRTYLWAYHSGPYRIGTTCMAVNFGLSDAKQYLQNEAWYRIAPPKVAVNE